MIETTWERAEPHENAIVAYLCYDSSLEVFETRRKPMSSQSDGNIMMFDIVEAAKADDVVGSGKYLYYYMRLPYSEIMLERRYERGADVPTWFIPKSEAA